MDADLQELRNACARQADMAEPPSLEELESLSQLLSRCGSARQDAPGSADTVLGDGAALAEHLCGLKFGPPAAGLHELVGREWAALENEWASYSTLKAFDGRLRRLLDPLSQVAADRQATADEIARQQERLHALRSLAELLDELIEDASPGGGDMAGGGGG